jgi:hypothetical protein
MSRVVDLESTAFQNLSRAEPCCHSLDIRGRTLCGAELTGARSAHPIGDCCVDGHKRCRTCDSLIETEEGVGPELEAA